MTELPNKNTQHKKALLYQRVIDRYIHSKADLQTILLQVGLDPEWFFNHRNGDPGRLRQWEQAELFASTLLNKAPNDKPYLNPHFLYICTQYANTGTSLVGIIEKVNQLINRQHSFLQSSGASIKEINLKGRINQDQSPIIAFPYGEEHLPWSLQRFFRVNKLPIYNKVWGTAQDARTRLIQDGREQFKLNLEVKAKAALEGRIEGYTEHSESTTINYRIKKIKGVVQYGPDGEPLMEPVGAVKNKHKQHKKPTTKDIELSLKVSGTLEPDKVEIQGALDHHLASLPTSRLAQFREELEEENRKLEEEAESERLR